MTVAQRLLGTIEVLDFDAFITACGFCYESYITVITDILQKKLFFFLLLYCYQRYNSLFEARCRADILWIINCYGTLFRGIKEIPFSFPCELTAVVTML